MTEGTGTETPVWNLIEETEIGLRKIVRHRFARQWGDGADLMIEKALGSESWETIINNRDKYSKNYSTSGPRADAAEVLNFTYLGQLGILMTWKKSWNLFRDLFRDPRELQDMLRDIMPVRNDGAHFRSVPEVELDRCRVRCVDLLAILDPIESVQAGKHCPICSAGPEYSRITDDEMRAIMKTAVNRVYALLRLKNRDPDGYARQTAFGARYVTKWTSPKNRMLNPRVRASNPSLFHLLH